MLLYDDKMRSKWNDLFLVLPFCALVWAAGLAWFVSLIPSPPVPAHENTDAIVVLTGGPGRLDHGFELLAEGRAQKMFISGVDNGVTLAHLLRSKDYRAFAGRFDTDRVTLGYKAHSTSGNAEETAAWVASEHIHSVMLVTGNYHIPRSIFELHRAAPDLVIIAEPVFPRYFEHADLAQWGEGIRLVVSEYMKYLVSTLEHQINRRLQ
jgi:uncharacterized SAM-binding protein YcdF (DUF218 family)